MSNGNNIFISSNHQLGGITAHTVNFGPTARAMNAQMGAQLKQQVPTSAAVKVVAVLGDSEAFGFANQILTWMKVNGYTKVDGVDQAVYSSPVSGQNINKIADDHYELVIGSRQ